MTIRKIILEFVNHRRWTLVIFIFVVVLFIIFGYFPAKLCYKYTFKNIEQTDDDDNVSCRSGFVEVPMTYYGDGKTFDVFGHVKRVVLYTDKYKEYEVRFNREGKYIRKSEFDVIKRDENGFITKWLLDDGRELYDEFEYSDDKLIFDISNGFSIYSTFNNVTTNNVNVRFSYVDGYVESAYAVWDFCNDDFVLLTNPKKFTTKFKYTITRIDDFGNWTERNVQGEKITLSDVGFELAGENKSGKKYYRREIVSSMQKREIIYY